jgi:hypothetical protein
MKKKEILRLTKIDELCKPNIARGRVKNFLIWLIAFVGIKIKDSYIWKVKVIYRDKSFKVFNSFQWLAIRAGIYTNLYKRGLCKVRFKTIYRNPLDNDILRELLAEMYEEKKELNLSNGLDRMKYNLINKAILKAQKKLNK